MAEFRTGRLLSRKRFAAVAQVSRLFMDKVCQTCPWAERGSAIGFGAEPAPVRSIPMRWPSGRGVGDLCRRTSVGQGFWESAGTGSSVVACRLRHL